MNRDGYTISDLTDFYDFARLDKSNARPGGITKITPHHMAGNLSRSQMENIIHGPREMSCNYAIYSDGVIEAFIPEALRSWCSSSWDNDKVAITIEVANDSGAPNWGISDNAYDSLVALMADICKRHGINPHYDGTAGGSITMHKMFAATACPGPTLERYITSGKLEADVKKKMNPTPTPTPKTVKYIVQAGAFASKDNAEKYADKLTAKGFPCIVKEVK